MKKIIPHGQSNYKDLILDNFYYVDRTMYIEKLEQVPNKYQFLLRPRKFGKSLFISMLQYYYGIEHKESFQDLFGDYYIGKNPTPLANTFFVLTFNFSGIATYDEESVMGSFRNSVLSSLEDFNDTYKILDNNEMSFILGEKEPADVLLKYLRKISSRAERNIVILIDEYDHFTNELLSFNLDLFKSSVASNGFVRKFFEVLKTFTGTGLVARLFATGVTPVTLDSLTSGFNIAVDLTLHPSMSEIMGFREEEVLQMLAYYEVANQETTLLDMRRFYNGSKFSTDAECGVYNSNMVWFFLYSILSTKKYPNPIIDKNIASDYSKIGTIFSLNTSTETVNAINSIIYNGEVSAELTEQFTFQRDFSTNDVISLLFYNGLLTVKSSELGNVIFTIPNYVIKELYWKFIAERFAKQAEITVNTLELRTAVQQMALEGKIDLYMAIINNTMKQLSNRDLQNFDEKYVKMLFMAFASLSPIYYKKSEYEVGKKYPDLMFLSTPVIPVENQMLFEFKYVKVSESHRLEEKIAESTAQIHGYLQLEEIKQIRNLHCYAIVFVGEVGHWRKIN